METLQRTANRGSISTGYDIDNSIMFTTQGTYADSGSYFYDVIASAEGWAANSNAGTNARKCTVSAWVKRTALTESSHYPRIFSYRAGGVAFDAFFDPSSDQLTMYDDNTSMSLKTNKAFRDTSSFYHIVVAVDQTQSTASNRVKVYVNGVQETSWATEDYGNQNVDLSAFRAAGTNVYVGGAANDASAYFNGYISEYNFIDGSQLAQTEFGEFDDDTGIWIPKKFTGSYGTLGHFYNFTVSNDMGKDFSGNGNDSNNRGDGITNGAARQATDTPTNNFCTWNTIPYYNTNYSFANGATEVVRASGTGWTTAYSSMGANKGKWYAEFQVLTSGNYLMNGNVPLAKIQSVYATQFYLGSDASAGAGAGYYSSGTTGNDAIYHDAGFTSSGVTTSAGDIISVAMDCDNNKIHFAVNGTYTNSSNPATNTNGFNMTDDYQFFAHSTLTGDQVFKNNFGGYTTMTISSGASDGNNYGTFEYAPPSGFYALNTKNLAEYG